MLNIFGKKREEKEDDGVTMMTVTNTDNEMGIYSVDHQLICSYGTGSAVSIQDNEQVKTLYMIMTGKNGANPATFLTCEYTTSDSKREIKSMMDILLADLQKARTKGVGNFVVPQTELDLYAYIKSRPTLDLDLDDLMKEMMENKEKKLRLDFQKSIQSGKKINIYVAQDSLYNKTAESILRNAYKQYNNVTFFDIHPEKVGGIVNWHNNTILTNISYAKNAFNIGIGIKGKSPTYAMSLVQHKHASVIKQAASLTMNPMNAREELLEAQATGHAKAMMEAGNKRHMNKDILVKSIKDLAKESAMYKYSESKWIEFESRAMESKSIENGLCIVRLPFNDPELIKNYFIEVCTGLLVILQDKEMELYYYGESETIQLLSAEHGWTANSEDFAYKVYDNRKAIYEVADITTKREFIKSITEALDNRDSLRISYNAIGDVAKKFSETLSLDMETQFKLLKYVEPLKDNEKKRNSIQRIITEALTPRVSFNPFGELFDRSFFGGKKSSGEEK